MNLTNFLQRGSLALALAAGFALAAKVADLPTTTGPDGHQMYYYDVARGETIYTIIQKLGKSREEIIAYNPSAADGLRPMMRLFFPVDDDVAGGSVTHVVKKGETVYGIARRYGITTDSLVALNPQADSGLKAGMRLILMKPAQADEPEEVAEQTVQTVAETADKPQATQPPIAEVDDERTGEVVAEAETADTLRMAVMLPFMLGGTDTPELERPAQLYTEFFRGLVMAADEQGRAGLPPVKITAFDTAGSPDSVRAIMALPEMADMDFIVAPDNAAQAATVAEKAPDSWVINIFGIRDTAYLSNPNVVQTNIPSPRMQQDAVEAFSRLYQGRTTIFLRRQGGAADKEGFAEALRAHLLALGRPTAEVAYSQTLDDDDLAPYDPALIGPVVFVPLSGSRNEFAKYSSALERLLKKSPGGADDVALWGYPEWVTFRGGSFDDICNLGATIYSRFWSDARDSRAGDLRRLYASTYGTDMFDAVPSQGLLGYDMGRWLISSLRGNLDQGATPAPRFEGVQSSINLQEASGDDPQGGLVNTALYIIGYTPGGNVRKVDL